MTYAASTRTRASLLRLLPTSAPESLKGFEIRSATPQPTRPLSVTTMTRCAAAPRWPRPRKISPTLAVCATGGRKT